MVNLFSQKLASKGYNLNTVIHDPMETVIDELVSVF